MVVLQLKAMGVRDPLTYDYITPPTEDAVVAALDLLFSLDALDQKMEITAAGRAMAQFPLDPKLAKVLLASVEYECVDEALTVVACKSVETIFVMPHHKREEAGRAHRRFAAPQGDHITLLNVFAGYSAEKGSKAQWCFENFVNARSMQVRTSTLVLP